MSQSDRTAIFGQLFIIILFSEKVVKKPFRAVGNAEKTTSYFIQI